MRTHLGDGGLLYRRDQLFVPRTPQASMLQSAACRWQDSAPCCILYTSASDRVYSWKSMRRLVANCIARNKDCLHFNRSRLVPASLVKVLIMLSLHSAQETRMDLNRRTARLRTSQVLRIVHKVKDALILILQSNQVAESN